MRCGLSIVLASTFYLVCTATPAHAAAGISVLKKTDIDSINSLTLDHAFATEPVAVGAYRASVYGLTFSLTAYDHDISIPLRASMIDESTLIQHAPQIGLAIDSRFGENDITKTLAVTTVFADTSSDTLTIRKGTRGTITVLMALAALPDPDREDRVRITTLPLYFGPSIAPLYLNASEVSELVSPYSALQP